MASLPPGSAVRKTLIGQPAATATAAAGGGLAGGAAASGPRASLESTPFGRRLHWVDARYSTGPDANTVFASSSVDFDPDLLTAVLSGGSTGSGGPPQRRRSRFSTEGGRIGIRVFDSSRAQNVAITLRCLPASTRAICGHLRGEEGTVANPGLEPEHVEQLLAKLPTSREAQLLLAHADHAEELRDVEREMLPFCLLPAVERRLRVLHTSLVHADLFSGLLQRLERMQAAAEEVLHSSHLHQLLRLVLKTANYINHGESGLGAAALPVRSLPAFASFRVGGASALHYLCLTLCSPEFLHDLAADLRHVPAAARESTRAQQQELRDFAQLAVAVEEHLGATTAAGSGDGGPADGSARQQPGMAAELLEALCKEEVELKQAAARANSLGEEAQRFFGDDSKNLPPHEEFFGHISSFIGQLTAAAAEVQRKPQAKWLQLPSQGADGGA